MRVEFLEQNEFFASQAFGAAICAGWPSTPDPIPLPSVTGTPPLLVIGGTRDLRTPLAEAQVMTEAIGNARLLVSEHYGHGATSSASECRTTAIRNYLERLELPEEGLICPP